MPFLISGKNDLKTLYPEISKEADGWDPSTISYGSTKKLRWKCKEGHTYEATPNKRTYRGDGCPYCSGKKIWIGFNDLATVSPKIAKEWHKTKNGHLTPDQVFNGSHKKVWWQCSKSKSHEWQAEIKSRSSENQKNGCPFCSNKKVCIDNCLETISPDIAKEWHKTKNGEITPSQVSNGSNKKVWWQCSKSKSHEWQAAIYSRTSRNQKRGCPFCGNRKLTIDNCLETISPDIAKEWHKTKNGDLTPSKVLNGSRTKVWWQCSRFKNHEWEAQIRSRTKGNQTGCPFCSRQSSIPEVRFLSELEEIFEQVISRKKINKSEVDIFIPELSLAIEYDGIYFHNDKELRDKKKNNLLSNKGINLLRIREKPLKKISKFDILIDSKKVEKKDIDNLLRSILLFLKSENYIRRINSYLQKKNFINEKQFKKYISCFPSPLYKNSFRNLHPKLSEEWHKELNKPLVPEQFPEFSHIKVWWQCSKDKNHEWQAVIRDRSNGRKCPFCSNRKVSIDNCLETISPDIAKEWHKTKNGNLTPIQVVNGSTKKVWWQCSKVKEHEWEAAIRDRTAKNQKRGCPFCSNRKVSIDNCLETISPDIAKEWHATKNGDLTPMQVVNGSHKKVWWQCSKVKEHEWEAMIRSRTKDNKTGCPHCYLNR